MNDSRLPVGADLHHELLVQMSLQRNKGGLTRTDVVAWHKRLQEHTGGAIDAPHRMEQHLRELRRYLCTMAIDARMPELSQSLLELSRPPDLHEPPRQEMPGASDDERVRWLNLRAMVLEGLGALTAARDAFAEAGEAFARQPNPDLKRFAVLTNAVQSAYELGDDRRGARLLAEAERIAALRADLSDLAFDVAVARLQAAVFSGDVAAFNNHLADAKRLSEATRPAFLAAIQRFAALACLQLGDLDRALDQLPTLPPETAPLADLVPDTLVRLQVQFAQGKVDHLIVDRGLWLMGMPESQSDDWALCGALAQALFAQGKIGAATILATLFLRSLDTAVETLPQRRGISEHKRKSILEVFDALQAVLVTANYLHAAEELAALQQSLLYGCELPKGAYAQWAPSAEVAVAADKARKVQAAAQAGLAPTAAFADFLTRFELGTAPPAEGPRPPRTEGLRISFLLNAGRLIRVVESKDTQKATAVEMPLGLLANHVQKLHSALRRDRDAPESRAALGEGLFGPVAKLLAAKTSVEIAAYGPVASLPFVALPVGGVLLGTGRAVTIRTGQDISLMQHPATDARLGAPLRVAFALGAGREALSAPQQEVREIAALYAQDPGPLAEFNRASLLGLLAERPRILHIAAHFRMFESDPEASELVAADGLTIPLRTVFNRTTDLRATDLVFLAGCDSAGLSGMESFASQLIALGARHVIAALWPVDDGATHALAVATHAALAEGAAPPLALSLAQQQLQADPRYAAPHHWAAFQCYAA